MTLKGLIKFAGSLLQGYFILIFLIPQSSLTANRTLSNPAVYTIDDIKFKYIKSETFDKNALLDIMTMPKKKIFSHEDLEKDIQKDYSVHHSSDFSRRVIQKLWV